MDENNWYDENGFKWKEISLSAEEVSKQYGIPMNTLNEMLENSKKITYPTTICYEFYDENGDLLSDQSSYRNILSFSIDRSLRTKAPSCSLNDIKSYQDMGKEQFDKIKNSIENTTKGKYILLDFFIDYEIRNQTYCLLYFQYKIKKIDEHV